MKAADLPLNYNAIDILERNLPARADKTALLSAEREVTYGELSEEVNRIGNALHRKLIHHGDTVAILALDSVEWVAAYFGTIKIGAVALSLNTLLTADEFRYMLHDCRARIVFCHEMFRETVESVRESLPCLREVITFGSQEYADMLAAESPELEPTATHREDICCLNYSSGTTGEPKGIPHAHKDLPLTAQLWAVNILGLSEQDRTFAAAKLFFTFGTGGNLIFPFYVGASSVLLGGSPRDVNNVMGCVDRFKPTVLYNAPTGYAMALARPDLTTEFDLSSLRICVSAGEALPAPIYHQWKDRTGLDIVDGIGSTENYHIFLSNRPDDIRAGSSGKPFEGYDLKLVNAAGEEVPQGEIGNLWVRGESAALCYLHQYDKSRATYQGEWLVTGDKYYIDEDGYYWHGGRADDMLKVGGIWVSPVEVESTLLCHDAVLEVAVIGEEDKDALVKPIAYVKLNEGFDAGEALARELTEYCTAEMAAYKRPRRVEFVNELPKTATGKIQRFKLRG
ncbi:MAG: benzoate-CoA ligase family protein [Planctomycetota bacterium]|jgi:4-hydroxybenzoate-CoA ligase/benzoate-CoA ligase